MGAIYKRELKSLFTGMIAPVFIAFVLMMTGFMSSSINFTSGYPQFEHVIPNIAFVFLIIVPILTMRSFAEEKATRTDQLLYALPIKTSSIVMGKYLAMVTVHLFACAAMCVYPLILSLYGDVYFPTAYSAIFAFFLMGCAFIAIGMFISALSESQVISAVITIGCFLVIYFIGSITAEIPTTKEASYLLFVALCILCAIIVYLMTKSTVTASAIGAALIVGVSVVYFIKPEIFAGVFPEFLNSLNLFDRIENFMFSVFDFSTVVYYLSIVVLFGFLTVQSFDKRRWN